MPKDLEKEKELAAKEAVQFVKDQQIIGLGTGSTAYYVIQQVGRLVKDGMRLKAVPTSLQTAELAKSLHIELADINDVEQIDVTIDGADEFNRDLLLIKGGGGALLREKIVASITKQEIIITDSSKKVDRLGKFPLPLEVVPFAANYVRRTLTTLNGNGNIRQKDGKVFTTDQGNYIIDVHFGFIDDPVGLSTALDKIEGIVCHGLFINLAERVISGISETETTQTYLKPKN